MKPSVHLLVAVYLVMVTAVSNVMSSNSGHLDSAVHSEAILGVMIALVFFAIFEPHDENKS